MPDSVLCAGPYHDRDPGPDPACHCHFELNQPLQNPQADLASSVPTAPTQEDLLPLRARIDAIDRKVLLLLSERAKCANVIGLIKKQLGMPVYLPMREQEVIHNVTNANSGPLDNSAVRRLFERIIDETRALERKKYQDMPDF